MKNKPKFLVFLFFFLLIISFLIIIKSDKDFQINQTEITGVIRTSGLIAEERQKFGLNSVEFQITDFGENREETVPGYFLLTNELDDDWLGKCARITGNVPKQWQKKDKSYPYQRMPFKVNKIRRVDYTECNPYPPFQKSEYSGKKLKLKGKVVRARRPAPDIGYDYRLILLLPITDEFSSSGSPSNVSLVDIVPTGNDQWLTLEKYINKEITIEGFMVWGYAETRHFEISSIFSSEPPVYAEKTQWYTVEYPADFIVTVRSDRLFSVAEKKWQGNKTHIPEASIRVYINIIPKGMDLQEWVAGVSDSLSPTDEGVPKSCRDFLINLREQLKFGDLFNDSHLKGDNCLYYGISGIKQKTINNTSGLEFTTQAVSNGATHTIFTQEDPSGIINLYDIYFTVTGQSDETDHTFKAYQSFLDTIRVNGPTSNSIHSLIDLIPSGAIDYSGYEAPPFPGTFSRHVKYILLAVAQSETIPKNISVYKIQADSGKVVSRNNFNLNGSLGCSSFQGLYSVCKNAVWFSQNGLQAVIQTENQSGPLGESPFWIKWSVMDFTSGSMTEIYTLDINDGNVSLSEWVYDGRDNVFINTQNRSTGANHFIRIGVNQKTAVVINQQDYPTNLFDDLSNGYFTFQEGSGISYVHDGNKVVAPVYVSHPKKIFGANVVY